MNTLLDQNSTKEESPDLLSTISDVIYKKSGVIFGESKRMMIEQRINQRKQAIGINSTEKYLSRLISREDGDHELKTLLDAVLINETTFFRNKPQMALMETQIFPNIIRKRIASDEPHKPVRIWSSACSIGAEPYSLAMVFEESRAKLGGQSHTVDLEVLGSDISGKCLSTAIGAEYHERPVESAPEYIRKKYFESFVSDRGLEQYRVTERVKKKVSFSYLNLISDPYPQNLDIIFCRNVFIYFDDSTRKKITKGFHHSLNEDGCLVIEHSETIFDLPELFSEEFVGGTCVYHKNVTGNLEKSVKPLAPREETTEQDDTYRSSEPEISVERNANSTRITLQGNLDPRQFPNLLIQIKNSIGDVIRDMSKIGNDDALEFRMKFHRVKFISPEIPDMLVKIGSFARAHNITFVYEVADEQTKNFLLRHGVSVDDIAEHGSSAKRS